MDTAIIRIVRAPGLRIENDQICTVLFKREKHVLDELAVSRSAVIAACISKLCGRWYGGSIEKWA